MMKLGVVEKQIRKILNLLKKKYLKENHYILDKINDLLNHKLSLHIDPQLQGPG
jgi:hypothetical protein